ncbi:MAG: discoidin domain-containing protein, partial [Polyangiaceae bacterium]|nr:discoidin domain-containing protein [Polyangiaceae bacterium]
MRILVATCAASLLFAGCSDSNSGSNDGNSTGGETTGASGGAPGSGGTATGGVPTGGAIGATGGQGAGGSGSGGSATGGASNGGGAVVDGAIVVTSTTGAYWVTSGTVTESTASAKVTVKDSSAAQTWQGFGTAFNEMGWNYLTMLSEQDRATALDLLFGADGARFTWGRIPMGATDYAMDRYTLDEVPAGETDETMHSFSIARDEEKLIPFVLAAQAVKPDLRFWASPWTPPTWMKEGPFNDDSPFDGGTMKGDETTLGALAQYFVKFVQAYADKGIHVELVAPQNEPGYSGTYPTCGWAPEAYATFVGTHLGPALTAAGLDVRIMLGTFNGGEGDDDIISAVMGDATAKEYIGFLGYQWGMQSKVVLAKRDYDDVSIWQTEHKCGNYPWVSNGFNAEFAPNDDAYALESWGLIRDWIKLGVHSYSTWNAVLDTVGVGIDSERIWPQDALLTVDTEAKTLNVTPAYYIFRHFSRFVDAGATVVSTSGSEASEALAFKNPSGSIVTVLYNPGDAGPYTVAVGGKTVQFDMPGKGWATLVVAPASGGDPSATGGSGAGGSSGGHVGSGGSAQDTGGSGGSEAGGQTGATGGNEASGGAGGTGGQTGSGGQTGEAGAGGAPAGGCDDWMALELALYKLTTSSSNQPSVDSIAAVDGVMSTPWYAQEADPAPWIMVDFDGTVTIDTIAITLPEEGEYHYTVEVSADKENWEIVVDESESTSTEQTRCTTGSLGT